MPPLNDLDLITLPFAVILGALLGSFANVVIYRLPRGESVLTPASHCPNCGRRLTPLELVPIFSWLAQRGRCRNCRLPISPRYPVVELLAAALFATAWLLVPPSTSGWASLLVGLVLVTLLVLAAIDIDTHTLPDVLTLPALAVALLAVAIAPEGSPLPSLQDALFGAAIGAGILALVNRLGALILRRGRDTKERSWPIGFDNLNLAALTGMAGGWRVGVGFLLASVVVNLVTRKSLRWPEPTLYLAWIGALVLAAFGITLPVIEALEGTAVAAGAAAILGAIWWSVYDLIRRNESGRRRGPLQRTEEAAKQIGAKSRIDEKGPRKATEAGMDPVEEADDEPVALGFGDVKLAAVLGALLGPSLLLVALFLSFVVGAIGGLLVRALGGGREVPFGPYLALAGVLALLVGEPLLNWYLGFLGI